MADTEYVLLHPVTVTFKNQQGEREESIDKVSIREPRGKDMRALNNVHGDIAMSMEMVERLTNLDRVFVDEMHAADLAGIGEIIEGFMVPGKLTG
ncbi:phage tail assembly protein [Parasphingorhabdus sp.]|uniref:phage tail assembly protein n=1 Tax=Parasphingorhabdus sp. TaxID=2709688 RepID=UPI003A911DFB